MIILYVQTYETTRLSLLLLPSSYTCLFYINICIIRNDDGHTIATSINDNLTCESRAVKGRHRRDNSQPIIYTCAASLTQCDCDYIPFHSPSLISLSLTLTLHSYFESILSMLSHPHPSVVIIVGAHCLHRCDRNDTSVLRRTRQRLYTYTCRRSHTAHTIV